MSLSRSSSRSRLRFRFRFRPIGAALVALLLCLLAAPGVSAAQGPTVLVTRVDDSITPVMADHVADGVRIAEDDGHQALLIEIDTPGGLLESTRDIVQTLLGAEVPVVVHVTPSGARAASAGAYISLSAHILAMAPGTHLGAGTPVTSSGGETSGKVVEDAAAFAVSIAERRGRNAEFAENMVREGEAVANREAVLRNIADVTAGSRAELLDRIDGQRVTLDSGAERTLCTAGATTVAHDLGFFGELRQWLASPELAYLFLVIGMLALLYELAIPGVGFAGIAGVLLVALGLIALSVLPFNAAGLVLLALAAVLFIGEVFTAGIGVFAAGGALSLLLAGVFLFRGDVEVDPAVLWPTALVAGGGALLAGRLAWRARRAPPASGTSALVGREATVRAGSQISLDGAWWAVRTSDGAQVPEGRRVRTVDLDGLRLIVEPVGPVEADSQDQEDQP
ncbi:NfeD family protein [Streptomyces sp. NPDC002845]